MNEEEQIKELKQQALESYGENREDAMDTLAAYGEEAIPALIEIAGEYSKTDHQKHARKKIREIQENKTNKNDT